MSMIMRVRVKYEGEAWRVKHEGEGEHEGNCDVACLSSGGSTIAIDALTLSSSSLKSNICCAEGFAFTLGAFDNPAHFLAKYVIWECASWYGGERTPNGWFTLTRTLTSPKTLSSTSRSDLSFGLISPLTFVLPIRRTLSQPHPASQCFCLSPALRLNHLHLGLVLILISISILALTNNLTLILISP